MNENVPKWLIPGRVYDVLKWVGLLVLPTCAWLFGTVGPAWGMGERRRRRSDAQRCRHGNRSRHRRQRNQRMEGRAE